MPDADKTTDWRPWEVGMPPPDEPVEWHRNFGDRTPFCRGVAGIGSVSV